mmetsp:Transcript_12014/g.17611  ORF Transcript_12014/g.17611 Transcript_12014/m.17611 type:complete len:131 (-) Transcript_12014:26-418(-)
MNVATVINVEKLVVSTVFQFVTTVIICENIPLFPLLTMISRKNTTFFITPDAFILIEIRYVAAQRCFQTRKRDTVVLSHDSSKSIVRMDLLKTLRIGVPRLKTTAPSQSQKRAYPNEKHNGLHPMYVSKR